MKSSSGTNLVSAASPARPRAVSTRSSARRGWPAGFVNGGHPVDTRIKEAGIVWRTAPSLPHTMPAAVTASGRPPTDVTGRASDSSGSGQSNSNADRRFEYPGQTASTLSLDGELQIHPLAAALEWRTPGSPGFNASSAARSSSSPVTGVRFRPKTTSPGTSSSCPESSAPGHSRRPARRPARAATAGAGPRPRPRSRRACPDARRDCAADRSAATARQRVVPFSHRNRHPPPRPSRRISRVTTSPARRRYRVT